MKTKFILIAVATVCLSYVASAQDRRHVMKNPTKPGDSEYWDPEVRVVTPGAIPSDAIVLFDGKDCCPIATFKLVGNGQIFGRLVGESWGENYSTIPEAVKEMVKKNRIFGNAILK
jgi:hypothetical protein